MQDRIKTNPACKALYQRLRAKGKTGKQALIAVCNKLLKQVFTVAKAEPSTSQTTAPLNQEKNLAFFLFFYTVHVVDSVGSLHLQSQF